MSKVSETKSNKSVQKGERNNQLTYADGYKVTRMVFSEPIPGSVPNTPITYKRINISTLNEDGSIGDLIIPTERVFSFGVSENVNPETKTVSGHTLPLCLWNRDGATKAEKAWTDTFEKIVEHCKNHLIENKDELEQYDLNIHQLVKFNPLYWKRDKGKIVEGTGPTLYAKLVASKKHNKILSMFFSTNGDTIEPLSLLGKYCYARAGIKIESIFIGAKIVLQVKLYEAEVEMVETGMKSLLSKPGVAKGRMLISGPGATTMNDIEDEEEPARPGSVENSDEDLEEAEPAPKPVTKVVPKPVAIAKVVPKPVAKLPVAKAVKPKS